MANKTEDEQTKSDIKVVDEAKRRNRRKKQPATLEQLAKVSRLNTLTCIGVLLDVATNVDSPSQARISAANSLLDRGWGKSHEFIDIQSKGKRDSTVSVLFIDSKKKKEDNKKED